MSNSSSRPIHKHPAFWGLFIIVVFFFVDIIQIKSWFGELAEDKKEHKVNQAKIAKIKQENKEAINKLALKHDAIIDWDKKLLDENSEVFQWYKDVFTIEIQKALMHTQGKPVVLIGRIQDIFLSGKKTIVRIESNAWPPSIYYELVCNEGLISRILKIQNSRYPSSKGDLAIIANITEVKNIRYGAKVSDESVYIGSDTVLSAHGDGIDLIELKSKWLN